MDAQKILNESQSSVKLSRTTRGYTWEIKIYDFDEQIILDKINGLDIDLRTLYAPDDLKE